MITVLANESPHGVVRWERQSVTVIEPDSDGSTAIPLTIVREQGTAGSILVTYMYVYRTNIFCCCYRGY